MKAEACRIAKELADEHGGKPSQYMSQAWDIVKDKYNYQPKQTSRENKIERGSESMSGWGTVIKVAGSFLAKKAKDGAKASGKHANFMKAPKDSPKDVFSGVSKMFTKEPEKVEIPENVKKYLKETFRLK